MAQRYRDRREAGAALAARLGGYAGRRDVLVLGLARGGVPVAAEVAGRLSVPLDVLVVRKLGVPWAPEVAFGAVGPGGVMVGNDDIARRLRDDEIAAVRAAEQDELDRQQREYRAHRPPLDLAGRVATLVDDGIATGATLRAAVLVCRRLGAARVVAAVPVAARDAAEAVAAVADELVCPLTPRSFEAVGAYYRDFRQVADGEVRGLLAAATPAGRPVDRTRERPADRI
jgi:putative phosphoribosyl transferase